MYAKISTLIKINDDKQPAYNDYIPEYTLTENAREIFRAHLIRAATTFALTGSTEALDDIIRYTSTHIERTQKPTWDDKAEESANDLISEYFLDEIIEKLIEDGEASDDYNNDYSDGDGIFHETVVDQYYHPTEATELLDELYVHEEEDSGLWEDVTDYRDILNIKAAYTFGNAVHSHWADLIDEINELDISEIKITVANSILTEKDDEIMEECGIDTSDEQAMTEWCKETYEDEFDTKLREELKKQIKEIL